MAPLRVGIIGGGWIARRHVPALVAAEGVELVAACDSDLVLAQAVAGPRGAAAYERWEEMLERESLDAVWVCTPRLRIASRWSGPLKRAFTCIWKSRSRVR